MSTPTIDEPLRCPCCGAESIQNLDPWMACRTCDCEWDESVRIRPAPPADVAAAVDACFRECLLSSQAGFKNDVRTAFAALRAKLGVGS